MQILSTINTPYDLTLSSLLLLVPIIVRTPIRLRLSRLFSICKLENNDLLSLISSSNTDECTRARSHTFVHTVRTEVHAVTICVATLDECTRRRIYIATRSVHAVCCWHPLSSEGTVLWCRARNPRRRPTLNPRTSEATRGRKLEEERGSCGRGSSGSSLFYTS